jgi:simple sugar transport system ATP-binding protein
MASAVAQKDEQDRQLKKGEILLKAEAVEKAFPGIWEHLILDRVDFDVQAGEIHCLLGENGAGKTVLANILSGFYSTTRGRLIVRGKEVKIGSPKDALSYGIGMVHQEFTLVRPLTVAENVALGVGTFGLSFPIAQVEKKLRELSESYGLKVDPKAKIDDLAVGEQQRVEILKVLFHEPDVIILDEPTSVLTPQESQELFTILRRLADNGHGVVLITHRLEDVMRVADRVTVLKLGKLSGTKRTSETNENELVRMMIGPIVPTLRRLEVSKIGDVLLKVENLHVSDAQGVPAVKGVSLEIRAGEILGVAGVAGNGQKELVEALTGLRKAENGKVTVLGLDVTNASPRILTQRGVCHIPEERRRTGTAEGLNLLENLMMKDYCRAPFAYLHILNYGTIQKHGKELVSEFEILTPDLDKTEARILSGGNIQRMILARELWNSPRLVICMHPTYGLDLKAIEHTHRLFAQLKDKGSAILMVSEDLEEILNLSDRIAVMFDGKIVGIKNAVQTSAEELGLLMMGIVR